MTVSAPRWMPAWLKEFARTGATRAGCYLGQFPEVESLGAHLRALFERLRINCVLDVGAHVGQYGRFLRNIGYTGRIVSFEPVPANFERLGERRRGDRQWKAFRMALGSRDGTAPMNVACLTQFSSFLAPNRYSLDQFAGFSDVARIEPVEVRRLDGMFHKCLDGIADPRVFVKLDTQGYDLSVLEGAGAALERVRAVQSEVSVKPLYEHMTGYIDAMSALNRMGFEATGIFPGLRDEQLRIVEFDAVMVASHALSGG